MNAIITRLTEIEKNLRSGEIKFKYLKNIADEKFAFEEVLKLLKRVSDFAIFSFCLRHFLRLSFALQLYATNIRSPG